MALETGLALAIPANFWGNIFRVDVVLLAGVPTAPACCCCCHVVGIVCSIAAIPSYELIPKIEEKYFFSETDTDDAKAKQAKCTV